MQPDLFQSAVRKPRSQEEVRDAWRQCAVGLLNAGIPFTLIARERLFPGKPTQAGRAADSEASKDEEETKETARQTVASGVQMGTPGLPPSSGLPNHAPLPITDDEPVIHTLMDLKALIAAADPMTALPGAVVGSPVGTCLVIQDLTTDEDHSLMYLKRSLLRTVSMRYTDHLAYVYRLPRGHPPESPVRLKGNVIYDPRHQALPIPTPLPGEVNASSVSWVRSPDEVQVLPLPSLLR